MKPIVQCEEEPKKRDMEGVVSRHLLDSRTILLSGSIDDKQAHKIVGQMLVLDEISKEETITLIINSGGGSISSGFAIFDTIQMIDAPVRTVGTGVVASMGVTIFLAVPKEQRFSLPNTRFMIHQPLISGTMVAPASDLEINAREMIKLRDRLNHLIAGATGQPLKAVESDTQRDFWLDAAEATDYGIVGKVVSARSELG